MNPNATWSIKKLPSISIASKSFKKSTNILCSQHPNLIDAAQLPPSIKKINRQHLLVCIIKIITVPKSNIIYYNFKIQTSNLMPLVHMACLVIPDGRGIHILDNE
jgi:hypothetical protein